LRDEPESFVRWESASFAIEVQGERMCKLTHFKATEVTHILSPVWRSLSIWQVHYYPGPICFKHHHFAATGRRKSPATSNQYQQP